jgi:hypothetical protein
MTYLLLPDHPPDAIDDIALSTAIRADNARNALVKADMRLISKTLESFYFEAL